VASARPRSSRAESEVWRESDTSPVPVCIGDGQHPHPTAPSHPL